ncbi:MAG: MATE family efflux transporter [Rhodobacteraceae bacterium]|jgi:MATE family multidrug resistance protein|nr:MATE family efflux transporter [Paracoccaceae bacterium]
MADRQTYGAHARATLALGLPLIGSNLAQFGLHLTDTVMLGWYAVPALAAGVMGATSFFTLFVVGAGFAMAVMPMVAAAVAAGDDTEVRRVTRMGLWLSILFGVAVYPVLWFSGALLEAAGQEEALAADAQAYLRVAGLGMVPALVVMVLRSHLAALERAGIVLWVTLAGLAVNAALNWALIFGHWGAPELGVVGAAAASVAVQLFALFFLALYAARHPALRRHELFARFWRADPGAFARVFRLGWPIGLTGLAESGLFAASAVMMGWIGTRELAAHGIALEVAALTFMIHVGLSNAATVRAGQAHGQGDRLALRRGAAVAVALSAGVGLVAVAVMLGFPEALVGAFLGPADPDRAAIIAIGTTLLAAAAAFQFFDAAQVMALGLLRGVQDTRVPMVLASVSYYLVGIPASYGLGIAMGLGGAGVWAGLVIGLVAAGGLLMARFWHRHASGPGRG